MNQQHSAILKMIGITKRFPGVLANDRINLDLAPGEVHALLGENGAGKSTLMKILFGLYHADEGEIFWRGEKVRFQSPRDAISQGIGMVHQDFKLIQRLMVFENIVLGKRSAHEPFKDTPAAIRLVEQISEEYGLPLNPKAVVCELPAGMQQRVEIIKVLSRQPELIILDEPTSVLTPQETEQLFKTIQTLVQRGKSVCFITHKLNEVIEIADRVTVLRDGAVVGTVETHETNPALLAHMMVGRDVVFQVQKKQHQPDGAMLRVKYLSVMGDDRTPAVREVNLDVARGEILGIAGVSGNGQNELAEVICGLRSAEKGSVWLGDHEITHATPNEITQMGVAYIPDKARQHAAMINLTLEQNCLLRSQNSRLFSRHGVLSMKKIGAYTDDLLHKSDVRYTNRKILAGKLSGGNLQKMIIARELGRDPDLIVAVNPTMGVDVGAIEFIHQRLLQQRSKNCAILLISTELDELLTLSDRIAVMCDGRITGIVNPKETSPIEIGLLMGGAAPDESAREVNGYENEPSV
ncbi:MAG: ABC transporter ATP-binding protein [Anaerolineaceae bacterium]